VSLNAVGAGELELPPSDLRASSGIPLEIPRPDPSPAAALDPITHNIESIAAFYESEQQKVGAVQRVVENLSSVVGQPAFLGGTLLVVLLWIIANVAALYMGVASFDPAPFFWLQGIVSLLALLTTMVVLVRQERLAKLEALRLHLDLQVNLLTEQKTTKLIDLMEELRRDLPMVKNRRDAESEAMQRPTDPSRVLAEIDEVRVAAEHHVLTQQHHAARDAAKVPPATDSTPPTSATDRSRQ